MRSLQATGLISIGEDAIWAAADAMRELNECDEARRAGGVSWSELARAALLAAIAADRTIAVALQQAQQEVRQ